MFPEGTPRLTGHEELAAATLLMTSNLGDSGTYTTNLKIIQSWGRQERFPDELDLPEPLPARGMCGVASLEKNSRVIGEPGTTGTNQKYSGAKAFFFEM